MIRKTNKAKIYCVLCAAIMAMSSFGASALNLQSDLSYNFSNTTSTEYYNSGTTSNYNITEGMPGYVSDLYDMTPQTVYNSDFGTNIILPGGEFDVYPTGNKPYYAPETPYGTNATTAQSNGNSIGTQMNQSGSAGSPSAGTSSASSGGAPVDYPDSSSKAPEYPSFSYDEEKANAYKLTPIEQVRKSDGSIGTLSISKIGLNITVYDGDTFAAMLKGAGHIASTSAWNGNIGICGHNRGVTNNFLRLKELAVGDIIQYTTTLGVRKYKVVTSERISETDWSKLQYTNDNRISLVTCIENVPGVRLIIQAVQVS